MKPLASLLLVGIAAFGTNTVFAQGNGNPNLGQGQAPTGLFGHTPVPTPAKAAPPGEKKPMAASLTKDDKGKEVTTAFTTADPKIFLQWSDPSATKGDKVSVSWFAEDTHGVFPKNKKVTESSQTAAGPGAYGSLYITAPSGGLPPGKYRADVYDGSKLAKSLKFTVAKK